MIVSPEIDAVTSESTWNTRLSPPALTVTPAAGPVIVSVSVVLLSSNWDAGHGDRQMSGEHRRVEGDGRVSRAVGVGEGDGFTQAEEARPREQGIARRVHDQAREDRADVGQVERGSGRARGGRDDLVTANGVAGRGDDCGLAAHDIGRGGQEDRVGATGRRLIDEVDPAPIDRLDRVVGGHSHCQWVGERRADLSRLRSAVGNGREYKALALKGADVDPAVGDAAQAALVGGDAGER